MSFYTYSPRCLFHRDVFLYGVSFFQGGVGRVEGCQIWGNKRAGVHVQDRSSEAVVVGCKCAGGRMGMPFFMARDFIISEQFFFWLPPTQPPPGRIHDGGNVGVDFLRGGMGRGEDCQMRGNERAGVAVRGDGSKAVVVGCKCAGGRVGAFSYT